MQMENIDKKIYVVISEDEESILLLNKMDGRTYLYNKSTGEITVRPYWE